MLTRLGRIFDKDVVELVQKSSGVFALRVAGAILAFALTVTMARLLGAEGTGLYYLALSIVSFAVILSRLGLDNVLLRFAAAYAEQDRWPEVLGVYRSGTWLAAGTERPVGENSVDIEQ